MDNSIKILILDDDDAIRESFKYYFDDQGWDVWTASSAEDALADIDKKSPDCAIVDIRLPGINGEEFIRKVGNIYPKMVFVICTGSPEYFQVIEELRSPQVSPRIFYKPVKKMDVLTSEIQNLLKSIK